MAPRSYTSLPKRTTLTYAQRSELCEFARAHPTLKATALADWAALQFRLPKPPSDSTVRIIRKKEAEWTQALAAASGGVGGAGAGGDRRKIRSVQAPEVEAGVLAWISDVGYASLKGREVQAKAEELAEQLGIPADKRPKYSKGWLSAFQERHRLVTARQQKRAAGRRSLSDPIPARVVLTYKQRHELCMQAKLHPELNNSRLAEWATEKFRLRKYISNHTVSNILKNADKWGRAPVKDAKNVKHLRLPAAPEVDALLAGWVAKHRERDVRVTGKEIMDKGRQLAHELGIAEVDQPKFSKGWLQAFLLRHHLNVVRKPKRKSEEGGQGHGLGLGLDLDDGLGLDVARKKSRVEHLLN